MNNKEKRFTELISLLKDHDFRLTPQRIELIRLIATDEGHPSANDLYFQIKQKFPTMSQATVYNTLTLLKELNQVVEINLHDDSHYDGFHPEPHPHIICINCNRIVDGEYSIDLDSISMLEKSSGFSIIKPQITFYGLCPDCYIEDK
jgi:Fur family peroxide stress response transcriptional regulator